MLKLYLLGRPYVEVNGEEIHLSRRKNLALLAYLVRVAEPRRREELTALLWPELDAHHAQTALRRDLWVLRNTVGDDALDVTHEAVGCANTGKVWSDVATFQQHLGAYRQQRDQSDQVNDACIAHLVMAVQLYRDDFMAGFSLRDSPEFDEWHLAQAEALRHDLIVALSALVDAYRQQANRDMAISYAQRLLEVDPLHEPAHHQLMALYAEEERYGAALQQYARCAQILAEEVGGAPSSALVSLRREIEAQCQQQTNGRADLAARRSTRGQSAEILPNDRRAQAPDGRAARSGHVANLPTPPTPFSGRAHELAQIAERLASPQCRLLTVLGPGGVGKTRLAIEAAQQLQNHYADGVCFVGLAGLRHNELLPAAILEALGLTRETDRSPAETLLAYLQRRHQLLILDNFEHLRAGLPFIQRLLDNTEKLEMLVTSRERLNIAAEWLLPLAGMTYPLQNTERVLAVATDSHPHRPLDAGNAYDAVTFFRTCAGRLRPHTPLNPANDDAIVQICQLVEGFPLAIELAAAWLSVMSCAEIAAALQSGLEILSTTQDDGDERHGSMRAALAYSWRLAAPAEQLVLARLSVFHGGFALPLAQAVADADPLMVRALADKSWVHRLANGRIIMHELIRQFCAEKLTSSATDAQTALARHARVYGAFMQQQEAGLLDHRQVNAVEAVTAELDNIRAAWTYATENGEVELLHNLLESFYFVGLIRNWHEEMIALLTQAVAHQRALLTQPVDSTAAWRGARRQLLLARLHVRLAVYLADSGHLEQAVRNCNQSLELLADIAHDVSAHDRQSEESLANVLIAYVMAEDQPHTVLAKLQDAAAVASTTHANVATILAALAEANVLFESGEQAEAIALLTAKSDALRNIGELWLRDRVLGQLTYRLRIKNEKALVEHYTAERLELCQQLGDQRGVFHCFQDLSYTALFCHAPDVQTARRHMEEAFTISDALQNPLLAAETCFGFGQIAYFEAEWAQARRHFEESYAIYHALQGQSAMLLLCHLWLGEIALAQGCLDEAQDRFGQVLRHTEAIGVILLALEGLAKTSVRQGEIDPAAAVLSMIERHPSTWEFARGRVKELLRELQATLPDHKEVLATQHEAVMDLTEAIAWGLTMPARSQFGVAGRSQNDQNPDRRTSL